MANKEISWKDNIELCAQRFSRTMEEKFQFELKNGETLLPPNIKGTKFKEECAVEMLEIFLDYMFGTAAAISGHYCSLEEEFEENIVQMVRDKFVRLRKMKELEMSHAQY